MIDFLFSIDLQFLRILNVDIASPMLDQFWLFLSGFHRTVIFAILLSATIFWLFYIYRWSAFRMLIGLAIAVGAADAIAYRGIKSYVHRQRPFQNPEVSTWVRKVGDANGDSFPSNHTANCFAGAAVLTWYFPRRRNWFYTYAMLVGLSRIALGAHYPSDVAGGAMLGICVGLLVRVFLLRPRRWFWLRERESEEDAETGNWRTRTRRLEDS